MPQNRSHDILPCINVADADVPSNYLCTTASGTVFGIDPKATIGATVSTKMRGMQSSSGVVTLIRAL
ncbi:hypothetical protein WDW37_09035 [Bdellovibrionota bacterium FG-1]